MPTICFGIGSSSAAPNMPWTLLLLRRLRNVSRVLELSLSLSHDRVQQRVGQSTVPQSFEEVVELPKTVSSNSFQQHLSHKWWVLLVLRALWMISCLPCIQQHSGRHFATSSLATPEEVIAADQEVSFFHIFSEESASCAPHCECGDGVGVETLHFAGSWQQRLDLVASRAPWSSCLTPEEGGGLASSELRAGGYSPSLVAPVVASWPPGVFLGPKAGGNRHGGGGVGVRGLASLHPISGATSCSFRSSGWCLRNAARRTVEQLAPCPCCCFLLLVLVRIPATWWGVLPLFPFHNLWKRFRRWFHWCLFETS